MNELGELKRTAATRAQGMGYGTAPPGAIGDAPALPARMDPSARAEAARADRARDVALESAFRAEATDARWAPGAALAVQQALTGDGETPPVTARSVECRSTTCRVEMAQGDGDLSTSLPAVLSHLAGTLGTAAATHLDAGNGTTTTVLYLSR